MEKSFLIVIFQIIFFTAHAQDFFIGQKLNPTPDTFQSLGASSKTGVFTYKYIKPITDRRFNRQIGDIVVGVKNNIITLTIYSIIPLSTDVDVPDFMIKGMEDFIGHPLGFVNGMYGANVDSESITIRRANDVTTFNKDRIVIMKSVKQSILSN